MIRIKAISLNARDLQIAQDDYPAPHAIPEGVVPVSDGSGDVVAVGDQVDRFKVGDRVSPVVFTGHHHVGSQREQDLGPADDRKKIPRCLASRSAWVEGSTVLRPSTLSAIRRVESAPMSARP